MRVEWRRLRPGELDHEFLWLAVTLSAAGLASAWLAWSLPWPGCNFRAWTGLPCVTCGATRAALSFFHGHFGTAWAFNPLIFVGLCGIMLYDVYAAGVLVMRARRLRVAVPSRVARRLMVAVALLAGVGNWVYLLREFS